MDELIKNLRDQDNPNVLDYIDDAADALESANARIAELEDAQRWVPVTERLPDECGYYLAVVNRIAPEDLGGNGIRIKIMRWLGGDWRYPHHIPAWINDEIHDAVTHWRPLPAPPRKENNEQG